MQYWIFIDVSLNDDSKKSTQIDFEALAFVRLTMGANQMYEIILKSIDRNIACVEKQISINSASNNVERPLHTFVFYPKALGHLISFVYPTTSVDDGKYHKGKWQKKIKITLIFKIERWHLSNIIFLIRFRLGSNCTAKAKSCKFEFDTKAMSAERRCFWVWYRYSWNATYERAYRIEKFG